MSFVKNLHIVSTTEIKNIAITKYNIPLRG